jgi:hypothetical protein
MGSHEFSSGILYTLAVWNQSLIVRQSSFLVSLGCHRETHISSRTSEALCAPEQTRIFHAGGSSGTESLSMS